MTATARKTRLVITGASGMVGGYALRYALNNSEVKGVTSIARKKLGIAHPKLKEVLHQNFADCSPPADALSNQDAVVYCLRTYTGSVSDEQLRIITADYTIEFARVFRDSSPDAAFSFLSGSGADQTGRSRLAFARYKGQAEKELLAAGFPRVHLFRPAYIYPAEPRKEPNFNYRLLRAIYPAFRVLFPNQVIRADDLARTMVDVVLRQTQEREAVVFENRDIRIMSESRTPPRAAPPERLAIRQRERRKSLSEAINEKNCGRRRGFVGLAAAKVLRRSDAEVFVVDRMNHTSFSLAPSGADNCAFLRLESRVQSVDF